MLFQVESLRRNCGRMRDVKLVVCVLLLCSCLFKPICAEEWLLPDGQTVTTMDTSTPPVSGAQRVQHQVVVPSAPSVAQLLGLLPKEYGAPISTSPYFSDAKVGWPGGQCAAFAQNARPDLKDYAPYRSANKMPAKARENGYEVNGTPRVGSVLIIAKPAGSTDGHAEVVTSVMKVGEKFVLTIMDSNANKDEIISARTVYYTPSDNGVFGNFGSYEEATPELTKLANDLIVMGFIHEKR